MLTSPAIVHQLERLVVEDGPSALALVAERLDRGNEGGLAAALRAGAIGARDWADACDRALASGGRSGAGTHATPWRLADWLAEQVAGDSDNVILDPACGTGHLLVAAAERASRSADRWLGWDLCPGRVAAARISLWLAQGRLGIPGDLAGVRCLDSLLDAPEARADRILVNPPFVSIRELARSWEPAYADRLRATEPRLTGNFDLYVPFLLRLLDWLAPGGRFGAIVPATVWSAAYAAPVRRRLVGHLAAAHRICGRGVFPEAAVTTHVLLGTADRTPTTSFFESDLSGSETHSRQEGQVAAEAIVEDGYPAGTAIPRRPTVRLGDLARVAAGTPGYHAHRVAQGLRERGSSGEGPALPFIVTRSIDRYALYIGPVRFLKRRWERPEVVESVLSDGKRRLFRGRKVVVAGVSRRLEAARDDLGVALGVGVYAVVPRELPTELVLALLNSRVVSDWYRHRFLGRELSGGYFAVNVAQLESVPVPRAWLEGSATAERLIALVCARERSDEADQHGLLDTEIDALVAESLGL